ncbi:HK97 family phage prohead protease [Limnoglobus roseus]|uniref:HK97 family phage prohead protease n=1 Tax=Limnoglobus roseus TaxID=2598579 RepID=UPI00143D49B6|nr:HK97 family phage prohead protease [Limnoglobus roseus]
MSITTDRRVSFYAALYGAETRIDEGRKSYMETISSQAFTDFLRTSGEVLGTVNHLPNYTYAKRTDGSLLLQSDKKGLFTSSYLPDNEVGDYVYTAYKQNRVKGASFQSVPMLSRTRPDGVVERESLYLYDVTIAIDALPAYPQTATQVVVRLKQNYEQQLAMFNYQKMKLGL